MRSQLIRTLVPVLLLLTAGCTTSGSPEPSATLPATAIKDSAWAFFLDTGDDGDDPWTPGCHYRCSNPSCGGELTFWGGDSCNGDDLQEWTTNEPHAATSDIVRHDCSTACRDKGSSGGRCVVVENACNGTHQSSRCECD